MEHVEEHRTTIHRKREINATEKTSSRYARIKTNGALKVNSLTDDQKTEEQKLKERGISIVDSSLSNFSNVSPTEVIDYYKGLGEWQDVLPKTDYAYSPVSVFNKKKINGIYPVIPNMSRRRLWSTHYQSTQMTNDRIMNSMYTERHSAIRNSRRWYVHKDSELAQKVNYASSYSGSVSSTSTRLRQWISDKRSSFLQSSAKLYWRSHSYFKAIRTRSATVASTSSSWLKILVRYVFPFLFLLFLILYFSLWSPFPAPLSSPVDYLYKYSASVYASVSLFIESLISLVYSFINFTLSSGTFSLSCISWPSVFTLKTVSDLVFAPLHQEFWTLTTSSKDNSQDAKIAGNEKIRLDDTQIEVLLRRLFDARSLEFAREITNSREFSDVIDKKLKHFEDLHTHAYEKLILENTNFQERLKTLESLIAGSKTSEQINELRAGVLALREEIRLKETKIENEFFILLSSVVQTTGSGRKANLDDLKTKFVSIFRSIEEAHYKIDKLNREFSNYANNASDTIEIVVARSRDQVKRELRSFIEELMVRKLDEWKRTSEASANSQIDIQGDVEMLEKFVKKIVQKALDIYDADKTGMADYALESSGGVILSTRCTETKKSHAQFSILGIPFWHTSRSPRTVIQPGSHPGECWAFPGSTGYLVIQLSKSIFITGVSLEHIPKAIALNGTIDSAPRDFSVWALRSETDPEAKLLGKFRYDDDGPSVQYYEVIPLDQPYQIVELKILSNHGKIDYTCLYRFRVHGIPA